MNPTPIVISGGPDPWAIVASISTFVAAVIAIFGLPVAIAGLLQHSKALQLQVFESIFRDIRELDHRYLAGWQTMTDQEKKAWSASFFNTVEYLSFMMNRKVVRQKEIRHFFKDALPGWSALFEKHVSRQILLDGKNMFQEFKKICTQAE